MAKDFGISNILDIIAISVVMLFCIIFFIKRKSIKLFAIYFSILLIYAGVYILDWFIELHIVLQLANIMAIFSIIALVVVYQADFKSVFFNLSKKNNENDIDISDEDLRTTIKELVKACQTMSKSRTGALIVIAPTKISAHILETGTELGALVTSPLIESIFNTKAPIHDGAVIIKGNKILAAGCFLPLSQSQSLPKDMGTRHRAAIGVTEESDMLAVAVSEENGIISIAQNGVLKRYVTPERLSDILHETFGVIGSTKRRYL